MPVHGPGGAFGTLVVSEAINTLIRPTGLWSVLPRVLVRETNPQWAYVTGFGGVSGSQPSDQCGPCQTAGPIRSCVTILPFGRRCVASESLDAYTIMRRYNQGELDLTLIGDFIGQEAREMLLSGRPGPEAVLEGGVAYAMYQVALELCRWITATTWSGQRLPTHNEGYAEFTGIDNQIITGRQDALTSTPCPTLDSLVVDFGDNYMKTDAGGSVLVRTINRAAMVLRTRAELSGLGPAEWAIVTSPEMSFLLAQMWSAAYTATTGFNLPSTSYIVDLSASSANRDRILSEGEIIVMGNRMRLIPDPGVPVVTEGSVSTTTIYIVPLKYAGRPATYLQFFDYRMPGTELPYPFTFTDNGAVQWWVTQNGPCWTISGSIKPRVVIEVPQLAAKITGVKYSPDTAMPFPVSGPGGGVGSRQ